MINISKWNLLTTILFTLVAIIYFIPNICNTTQNGWLPGDKVNLGLDLQGGSHLLLDVDFDNYLEGSYNSITDSLKKTLREEKIGYKNLSINKDNIKFDLRISEDIKKVKQKIYKIDKNLEIEYDKNSVILRYSSSALSTLLNKVVEQSIEIVRMRVDSSGTKEPIIQKQGNNHILLQVPGEHNPQQLKKILGKTAKLTFHMVDESASLSQASHGVVPPGSKIVRSADLSSESILVIKKNVIVSGGNLNNAKVSFDRDSRPVVNFSFDNLGAKKFANVTSKNRGKRLAIILDGKFLSAPTINEPILGGDGVISGNFTVESANELALLLRAGALPAPLKIIEERNIGPNLGLDSIESGKKAAIIGFILVVVFMAWSYGIVGIFANISLVISLLYIIALLGMVQATLTLPGIAGIILTIGMAVDANVLIYERIREEIRKGYSNIYAVKCGFDAATGTIIDSNITTLIAAFLLYIFGVGAIRGFAVTLTIGIFVSMFTALIVTKLMIDLWLKYAKPNVLLR